MKAPFLLLSFLFAGSAFAQNSTGNEEVNAGVRSGTETNPVMEAVRIQNDDIILDGILDEAIWSRVPYATEFTQRFPNDGDQATQKTEVRLLYTDSDIYVGIMAYDTHPDSVVAPLFRRDGGHSSDWVYVSFDSYNDKRTAFSFAVNPRGVQKDVLYFDDTNEDILWDAVWEARTQVLDNGWSAELKIPLSQLRFSSNQNTQMWGVNFQRRISRNGEISFWAPTPQNSTGMVSRFGRLQGIENLEEPRRLEIIPYVSGSLLRQPRLDAADPYFSRSQWAGNIGGDIKYGLTTDFTLTATVNPDFGQVEADPAIINLTANESFFEEKRPFFLEGHDIFEFGNTKTFSRFGNPLTFYSRRIGRSPQGNPARAGIDAAYFDQPDFTTIAAAAKVSGKTRTGWSVGVLNAYTLQENLLYTTSGGEESTLAAEPATNYAVGRTKKDFNSGNSYVGAFAGTVHRNVGETYFNNFLRSSAYLGGVDYEHNFHDRDWVTSGTISFSSINGSEAAIELAQNSPVRYYNRVDSDALSADPGRTNLSGFATEVSLQKRGGDDPWMGSLTFAEVSPGYETNDLGFQNRADYRSVNGGIVYRDTDPKILQYYEYWLFTAQGWNYDGDRINHNYGTGGFVRFQNLWTLNSELNYNPEHISDRVTRGGPIIIRPENWNFNINANTNPNKKIIYHAGTFQRRDVSGGFDNDIWAEIRVLPTPWLQMSFSPEVIIQKNTAQFITTLQDSQSTETYGNRYVFSDIDQTTFVAGFRLDWTFSPFMSLQTYIRPYVASGKFRNFKELAEPASYNFTVYGEDSGTIESTQGGYLITPEGGDSFQISDPDFNFRSIQGNMVFRWEYKPGSTLFLVWQQQREDHDAHGAFNVQREFNRLFKAKPTNVFLIKATYWFGS